MASPRILSVLLTLAAAGCSSGDTNPAVPPPPGHDASTSDTTADDVQGTDTAPQEASTPAPFRIVTWNVWALYDNVPGNCANNCPYEPTPAPSASDYQAKINSTASLLSKLAGDVVMLEEVENTAVLDKLASTPALASFNYQYRTLLPGNDPSGKNMAFMSRYPVDNVYSHKDDQFTREDAPAKVYRYTRDALEVHMTYRGKHVVLIGVHLRSKADPDDPDKRLAEAQHARAIADFALQGDPSAYVWILGDFNDLPGSPPVLAVQTGKAGPNFSDATELVAAPDRYSYVYNGKKELIDHLFANPGAAQRIDAQSVFISHEASDSDHAPVAATYQVP
ncbi:MAG: endonuclease/exonuclease/phosphatase family protein [Deltaproteobacteria bacterium]|nr:endonuclease/exonuclease/phosphatase family protein [Deltaproteobacteria bacterium]